MMTQGYRRVPETFFIVICRDVTSNVSKVLVCVDNFQVHISRNYFRVAGFSGIFSR